MATGHAQLTDEARTSQSAPRGGEVRPWRSVVLVVGGPLAWMLQEALSYGAVSGACARGGEAGGLRVWIIGFAAAALLAQLLCFAGAWRDWRRTRDEHDAGGRNRAGHGEAHHALIEVGEGRTRFLAMLALMTSAGFALGTLFFAMTLLASTCAR